MSIKKETEVAHLLRQVIRFFQGIFKRAQNVVLIGTWIVTDAVNDHPLIAVFG